MKVCRIIMGGGGGCQLYGYCHIPRYEYQFYYVSGKQTGHTSIYIWKCTATKKGTIVQCHVELNTESGTPTVILQTKCYNRYYTNNTGGGGI